jgi:DNA-binding MarR family transcriptional regulator
MPDPVEGAAGSPIPSRPPQAVGFLLSQLGFETSARFANLMAEVDLEPRQFALMRAIEAFDGQPQNSVGEWLRIPPSSMVAVIDHLESRGLVERRLHPTDRRSRTLHMTPLGTDVLKRATELAMGLEQTICKGFDADRRSELIAMLVEVADNLGLVQGLHPGSSTSHSSHHWTDNQPA